MYTVFLTRKYPPSRGGMETFSASLEAYFPGEHTVVHFGRGGSDIWWVAPRLLLESWKLRKKASVFHLGDGVLIFLAPLMRLWTRVPIIATVHALELLYTLPMFQPILTLCMRAVTHFVAVSDYTAGLLRTRGISEKHVSMIPHGADHIHTAVETIDVFTARKSHARAALISALDMSDVEMETTLLLTVGRLVPRKGVAWFIEHVIEPLVQDGLPVSYFIIGQGPEQSAINAAIQKHGLHKSVFVLGKVSEDILSLSYSAADVFVMPNMPIPGDAEGFGFVAIEAARLGLPVLASNLEGIPSAIHTQKNGVLVTAGDAPAYQKQIQSWTRAPKERIAFGFQAAQYTAAQFSWKKIAQLYQELFESLAK